MGSDSKYDDGEALPQRLPPALRAEFLSAEIDRMARPTRVAIAVTITIVALFGIRDWIVAPQLALHTALLRGLSVSLGLLAITRPRSQRRSFALVFIYGLLLSHSVVISLLPLGFRYQLTSLLIIPLGASMFVPEVAALVRMQAVALLAVQVGVWYQAPPTLDVVAVESALALTSLVTYLLGTMGIRARQHQFLLERRLREEARRDALTGAYNRRHLEIAARAELRRAARFDRPLGVIVVDIDAFKRINDQHGHAVGDLAIQATAACLQEAVRDCDLVARLGGDEFVLLLPETGLDGATALAERLKAAIASGALPAGEDHVRWTISCGVAAILPTDTKFEDVLLRADSCLYAAKDLGGNRAASQPVARGSVAELTAITSGA
jgi:diguanylate cyclase (GGDEF)-like protein